MLSVKEQIISAFPVFVIKALSGGFVERWGSFLQNFQLLDDKYH